MKPSLEYGQTEAYVAPRQDNLSSRIMSTPISQRVRWNQSLDKPLKQP